MPPLPTAPTDARRRIVRDGIGVGLATGAYGISFGALGIAAGLDLALKMGKAKRENGGTMEAARELMVAVARLSDKSVPAGGEGKPKPRRKSKDLGGWLEADTARGLEPERMQHAECVVARRPSSRPAWASTNAPVQRETMRAPRS